MTFSPSVTVSSRKPRSFSRSKNVASSATVRSWKNGESRDMVVAVRELEQSGLEESQRNWANLHTVYTHGYGVIGAYGNQKDSNDQQVPDAEGKPIWSEQDIPPRGELSDMFPDGYQPRMRFRPEEDKRYPRELLGEILLVDVRGKTATAVVMRSSREVEVGDHLEARKGY